MKGERTMAYEKPLPQCPFYEKESRRTVICEGVVERNRLHMKFATEGTCAKYRMDYCYSMCWENCPVAKMLNAKYGV